MPTLNAMQKQFKAARGCSTPLISIKTPDQAVTVQSIAEATQNGHPFPLLVWDCIRGCTWANQAGLAVAWTVLDSKPAGTVPERQEQIAALQKDLAKLFSNPVNMLDAAQMLPGESASMDGSVLVMLNFHMWWDKPQVVQAAWNLRDAFKSTNRTLVFLTDPAATLPRELRDALPLKEEFPTLEELDAVVKEQFGNLELPDDPPARAKAVDAICGLPNRFSAEQAVAMSFVLKDGKTTLDTESLWLRKKEMIEQGGDGIALYRGPETFATLGGLDVIKSETLAVITGRKEYRVIVFIDEIEKAFGGLGNADTGSDGDSSGTTQEMLGLMLREMQDQDYTGEIIVGPPGTGKSAFAKSLAGETRKPLIILDLSAAKSKYVGDSTAHLARLLGVIRSVSQGRAFFIATCNSIGKLPTELKRRFRQGVFFMDLPTDAEKEPIWQIWLKHFQLDPKQKRPVDTDWTGADIRACCEAAWQKRQTLVQAAKFLTPVAQTDAARIRRLREDSSGKYLSASHEGYYTYNGGGEAPAPVSVANPKRRIRVGE